MKYIHVFLLSCSFIERVNSKTLSYFMCTLWCCGKTPRLCLLFVIKLQNTSVQLYCNMFETCGLCVIMFAATKKHYRSQPNRLLHERLAYRWPAHCTHQPKHNLSHTNNSMNHNHDDAFSLLHSPDVGIHTSLTRCPCRRSSCLLSDDRGHPQLNTSLLRFLTFPG